MRMKFKSFLQMVIVLVALLGIYDYVLNLNNVLLEAKNPTAGADETNAAYNETVSRLIADTSEYDFTVLIEPVAGGTDTGNISDGIDKSETVLSIAGYVDSLNTNDKIRVVLTRYGDTNPTAEQIQSIADIISPDMAIRLVIADDLDTVKMGVSVTYDDSFYNYKLTNSDLADECLRDVTTRAGTKAAGVVIAQNDYYRKSIPMCTISCGYASNTEERMALNSDAYRQNIAQGILDAIGNIYGRVE